MQTWFLVTQKGGAAKTTLSTNLAVCAADAGKRVLLVDLDPQESAANWWMARPEDDRIRAVTLKGDVGKIRQTVQVAKDKGFDLVIFDTAGHDTVLHDTILDLATLCIIPCQPSLLDVRAVKSTIGMVERIGAPFVFVITRSPPVGQEFATTSMGLSGHGQVCPIPTVERKAYKLAYNVGQGVTEFDAKDKAATEMRGIYDWTMQMTAKLNQQQEAFA